MVQTCIHLYTFFCSDEHREKHIVIFQLGKITMVKSIVVNGGQVLFGYKLPNIFLFVKKLRTRVSK